MEKSVKLYGNNIVTIANVLTPEGCEYYKLLTETAGYEAATVNMGNNVHELKPDYRNNSRVNIEDDSLAYLVWQNVKEYVPQEVSGHVAYGLDNIFRCYRYEPGEYFNWHVDGATKKDGNRSLFTILIYLHSAEEGGETEFEAFKVNGEPGSCLIFPHKMLHRGVEVTKGVKYVMRSDIMYKPMETTE